MKAMILAAGRGRRMRPLTDTCPKPLLQLGGQPMIVRTIQRLAQAGFRELVINVAHLGQSIIDTLGDGARFNVSIQYSREEAGGLETGGGIYRALPLLGSDPFLVVSADIVTDYPFESLPQQPDKLAHILLVDNPSYHPEGDFSLQGKHVHDTGDTMLTYANLGIFTPQLFAACSDGYFPLAPILRQAIKENGLTGEYYNGRWYNVGTPEDLETVNRLFIESV